MSNKNSITSAIDFFDTFWQTTYVYEPYGDRYTTSSPQLPKLYTTHTGTFDRDMKDWNEFWKDLGHIYGSNFPPMNMYVNPETKDVVYEFAVAGVPRDHIKISVEEDYLVISTEKVSSERKDLKLVENGIKRSSTTNRYYIPGSRYQLDKIKAGLEDGILTITVPAREETRPRVVEIE